MQTPKSSPARLPERLSSVGMTTSRIVPGSMVLRDDDDVEPGLVAQRGADLLAHRCARSAGRGRRSPARRADADERQVAWRAPPRARRWWRAAGRFRPRSSISVGDVAARRSGSPRLIIATLALGVDADRPRGRRARGRRPTRSRRSRDRKR